MNQDSILNLVQSKETTDQPQMPISFNLGKLSLSLQTSNTEKIITKPLFSFLFHAIVYWLDIGQLIALLYVFKIFIYN